MAESIQHRNDPVPFNLREHSSHDYDYLIETWKKVVQETECDWQELGTKDGLPLYALSNRRTDGKALYLSAGIHGDEAAPPWGLLSWFAQYGARVAADRPLVIFPCLNPRGFVDNRRTDDAFRDLNRFFNRVRMSPVKEVRKFVKGRQFEIAICLHEDYDALGIYAYDLNKEGDGSDTQEMLKRSGDPDMPVDCRDQIEGRPATHGVIHHKELDLSQVPGMPEALFLYVEGYARRTITFETPSEFDITHRIRAHHRFIEEVVEMLEKME